LNRKSEGKLIYALKRKAQWYKRRVFDIISIGCVDPPIFRRSKGRQACALGRLSRKNGKLSVAPSVGCGGEAYSHWHIIGGVNFSALEVPINHQSPASATRLPSDLASRARPSSCMGSLHPCPVNSELRLTEPAASLGNNRCLWRVGGPINKPWPSKALRKAAAGLVLKECNRF
jgi:hypothetical protein